MKNIIIFLILVLSALPSIANEEIVAAYRANKMWHFVDRFGEEIFEPKSFYNIGSYSEGMIIFQGKRNLDEWWGYLDSSGNVAFIVDSVDMIREFHDGMAIVEKFKDPSGLERYYNFIDKNGNKILNFEYIDVTQFNEGLAWVMNFEERGYINKEGEFVLKFKDKQFGMPFVEGLAAFHDSTGRFGFINKKGELIVEHKYDQVLYYSEGLCPVNTLGQYGYIDNEGDLKIPHKFGYARPFIGDFAFAGTINATMEPVWGIINKNGNYVVQPEFEDTRDFVNGIACVEKLGKWYFIDNFGNKIVDKGFKYADSFINGIAFVNDGKNRGYIDLSGQFIFKFPPNADIIIDLRVNRAMK